MENDNNILSTSIVYCNGLCDKSHLPKMEIRVVATKVEKDLGVSHKLHNLKVEITKMKSRLNELDYIVNNK